jgi:hypothetical protein
VRLTTVILGAGLLLTGSSSSSQSGTSEQGERDRGKTSSIASPTDVSSEAIRLDLKARGVNLSAGPTAEGLRNAFTEYDFQSRGSGLNSNKKELWEAAKSLSTALTETSLQSRLIVRTQKPGARVWYRLVGRDAATPFNQLTNNSEEDVSIGLYYIWAERGGKATSSKNIVSRIIQKKAPCESG